tara:strand:- start:22191 stop:23516 length:1326 start_codon:yes stop_codon:yes gene_type:complete
MGKPDSKINEGFYRSLNNMNFLKLLFSDSRQFHKNIFTLVSGSSVSQIISILFIPLLSRLYMPADFGLLAIFIALLNLFGSIINGRYEMAIFLPKSDNDAIQISRASLWISLISSIVIAVIILFLGTGFSSQISNIDYSYYFFWLPISIFFVGIANVYSSFSIRLKNFRSIANASIIRSLSCSALQAILGFYFLGPVGLILGSVISWFLSSFYLLYKNLEHFSPLKKPENVRNYLRRYKDMPLYSMPAIFFNRLSINLVNIFLPLVFSLTTIGLYSMTQRLFFLPMSLLGSSIGQALTQSAAEEKNQFGSSKKTFKQSLFLLSALSLIIFTPLYFSLDYIFGQILGNEWLQSATFAKTVYSMFVLQFIGSSLSPILIVFERQSIELTFQAIILFVNIGIIFYVFLFSIEFLNYLSILNIFMSIYYLFMILVTYLIANNKLK